MPTLIGMEGGEAQVHLACPCLLLYKTVHQKLGVSKPAVRIGRNWVRRVIKR
jgi:hypothetical protein